MLLIVGQRQTSKALGLHPSRAFPTTVAPTLNLECCFSLSIPALFVIYHITNVKLKFTNAFDMHIIRILIFVWQPVIHRNPTQLRRTCPNNEEIHEYPPLPYLNVPTTQCWGQHWLETMGCTTLKLHMRNRLTLRSRDASGQQGHPLWRPPQLTEERRQRLKGQVQGRSNYNWHFQSWREALHQDSVTMVRVRSCWMNCCPVLQVLVEKAG